ncbi:E3 ubiquitin-protein ligase RNF25 [Aricia agestis]|uniref:E3 ubiquitin-protein ligase RNF25 n=1 Tax=Aricia agestis TaxID=91739 RepID=UPI001C2070A2|nr:E3 ubiquitin-protein ligase RNF25 [Aricia agestis]
MSAKVDERVYDEIEALEAILIEDLVVKHEDGVPKIIETVIHPSTADNIDQQFVCITLEVRLTPDYPDSSPEVFLRNPRGLDDQLLSIINTKIREMLNINLGNPVIFELIELVREFLTQSNLPSGQCVICLHGFTQGDVFIKTQCYHHFHSHCLSKHLIAGKKYYQEELDKLPNWQQVQAPAYQQTCPVCRCLVAFDVETLKKAPPPVDSLTAPPFHLTAELKALQQRMADLLARQVARGGVVGMGDDGPPPLTITTPSDNEEPKVSTSGTQDVKVEAAGGARPGSSTSSDGPASPASPNRASYKGPFRGFNRRGKPGRRGRGGR